MKDISAVLADRTLADGSHADRKVKINPTLPPVDRNGAILAGKDNVKRLRRDMGKWDLLHPLPHKHQRPASFPLSGAGLCQLRASALVGRRSGGTVRDKDEQMLLEILTTGRDKAQYPYHPAPHLIENLMPLGYRPTVRLSGVPQGRETGVGLASLDLVAAFTVGETHIFIPNSCPLRIICFQT